MKIILKFGIWANSSSFGLPCFETPRYQMGFFKIGFFKMGFTENLVHGQSNKVVDKKCAIDFSKSVTSSKKG